MTDLYTALADRALITGLPAGACGVLALPDVVLAEGHANGLPALPTDTPRLDRADGRYCMFLREPRRVIQ